MPSIHNIVAQLNTTISGIFPEVKTYGIAQSARRDEEVLPYYNEQYIGIDDTYKMQVYHKLNSMTSTIRPANGYGDSQGVQVNTYGMSMIVFINKILERDEVVLLIQSNFPETLTSSFYRSVRLTFNNAILNSANVYQQEYQTDKYRLFGGQYLIQINYSLETVFKKGCFIKCPEDIQKCLN